MGPTQTIPLPGAQFDTQAIDLYGVAGQSAILFVHGGGWYAGKREAYAEWADHAARLGYSAGSVGYRTDPESTYHDKMSDIASGLRILAEQADPVTRVVLVGSSAGAHLVTALALSGVASWTDPSDLPPLSGVVSMNGPGSMRPEHLLQAQQRLVELGLSEAEIDLLDRPVSAAPLEWLFLNAENETYFPHEHVAGLAARLTQAGHRVETVVVPGTDHGFGYQVLSAGGPAAELSRSAVEACWTRAFA